MKFGKKKTTGIVAISLAAVALSSVGFAAWVINANDVTANKQITVSTGTLTDKRFTLTAKIDEGDSTVAFDSKEGGTYVHGDGGEDLTFKVNATLEGVDLASSVDSIYVNFKDVASQKKISELVNKKIIQTPVDFSGSGNGTKIVATDQLKAGGSGSANYTAPETPETEKYSYSVSGNNTSLTISFTFNFTWGSIFNYKNPTESITSSSDTTKIDNLKDLANNYQNPGLEVVFTAVAKAS
mgnify:CR=1 FL=1